MDFAILSSNIKNLPFQKYEKDFTFIVDGEKFETSRIVADILSPIIRNYHYVDESINEFTINTKGCCNYFGDFLNLSSLNNINIDQEQKKAFSEYFLCLGNIYEYFHMNSDSFNQIKDKNIFISNIQLISKYSSTMSQESYQKLINLFSTNFQYLDKESLKVLDADLLEDIIGSKTLQICDEDSLFEFILELYKEDKSYSKLFEYVIFSNLSENLFKTFVSEVSIYDLNSSIWQSVFYTDKKRKYAKKKKPSSKKNQQKSDTSSSDDDQPSSENDDDQSSSENDDYQSSPENDDNDNQKPYRIVFIGNSKVGKTSIINRMMGEDMNNIGPTISPLCLDFDYKGCQFKFWDTAGESRFQTLSRLFYREANIFVIVYDVTNRESFSSLNEWYEISKEIEPNANYVIVANNATSQNRVVSKEEGKKYAIDHGFKYLEIDVHLDPSILYNKFMKKINNALEKTQ